MDNQIIPLPLPIELHHPFFFSTKVIEVEISPSMHVTENFMYDALFYNGIASFKPWENPSDAIPQLIEEWKKDRELLEALHRNRDQKNTLKAMKKGIGLFIQFLFWSNNKPVLLKNSISLNSIEYKPVNIEERLAFIISRPTLFHSFRQLSELMVEQEKIFVKKSIMEKASRPNG